ncbi:hypothetical protein [Microbulbifer spongiae]|uniref:DUF4224 domain-containing protein n=1 Tax=Microbulbifer spongiae TaxID=2944933 RepID=A0ABY9EHA5_9GAMM|nr:hypothetical protein [Microbulbifer sp. MI-G]WKD51697.1 DUF4224 domain-containing protein [Microbulbifer sp. MI-G]
MSTLLQEEELKAWIGVKSRAKLMDWLDQQELPYRLAPGGRVVTELGAISEALSRSVNDNWNNPVFGNAGT